MKIDDQARDVTAAGPGMIAQVGRCLRELQAVDPVRVTLDEAVAAQLAAEYGPRGGVQ